jgi:hypothetical protein
MYIALYQEYFGLGETLEEAFEAIQEYDYETPLNLVSFYEAKELEVKQEIKVVQVSTIKKVK